MFKDKSLIPEGIFCLDCPYRKEIGRRYIKRLDTEIPIIKCEYLNMSTEDEERCLYPTLFSNGYKICGIKDYLKLCLECSNFMFLKDFIGYCYKYGKKVEPNSTCNNFEPNENADNYFK